MGKQGAIKILGESRVEGVSGNPGIRRVTVTLSGPPDECPGWKNCFYRPKSKEVGPSPREFRFEGSTAIFEAMVDQVQLYATQLHCYISEANECWKTEQEEQRRKDIEERKTGENQEMDNGRIAHQLDRLFGKMREEG